MECPYCKVIKEPTEFRKGLRMCKKCQYERNKKNYQKFYEKNKEGMKERFRTIYYKPSPNPVGRPKKEVKEVIEVKEKKKYYISNGGKIGRPRKYNIDLVNGD